MFLQLATGQPEHYLVVDARAPIEEIATEIRARVEPLLEAATRTRPEEATRSSADSAHPASQP